MEIVFTIFGVLGLALASLAIWIRKEKRQDWLFILAGIFLLIYSIGIKNIIFSLLQVVFIISALAEIIRLRRR